LLGDDTVFVKNGRLSLNKLRCWVDVWVLEEQLDQLQMTSADPVELRTLADKIIALYQGPFMNDEDGIWVERLRQRLQSKYFRFILHYGRTLSVEHVDEGQAARSPKSGAAFDPCADDYYRSLLTSYTVTGQRGEVLEDYAHCREILTRDIGIIPAGADKIFRGKLD
jgi:two-component SAPR family response regulator